MAATYRIAEAAALLGVSDDTVRRWIDSGRLVAHLVGGAALVADHVEDGGTIRPVRVGVVCSEDVHAVALL